mmetsp:Transcript_9245/g.21178  ORF Transcript_9245/g.21178 Transcript_9245/m.21178 type:complete len:222 (+) Transcript_9245:180-845(+)
MMKLSKIHFALFVASATVGSTSALQGNYLNSLSQGGFQQQPQQPPQYNQEPSYPEPGYQEPLYPEDEVEEYYPPPATNIHDPTNSGPTEYAIPVGYGADHQNNRQGGKSRLAPGIDTTANGESATMGRDKMAMLDSLLNASATGDSATMGREKMEMLNQLLNAQANGESATMGRDKMAMLDSLLNASPNGESATMGRDKMEMLNQLLNAQANGESATMGRE